MRLVFSEYVDQTSFVRAFSITPPLEGRLRFQWRKRRVDVHFPGLLRQNTTFVLTIDSDLRDLRGVPLSKPITLAFATGPVIDEGRLSGRVLEPVEGLPAVGFDVFAYPADVVLPDRPAYRTETDQDGSFALSYLRSGPYHVVALQDRNRNLRLDPGEAFGVAPKEALETTVDTTAADMHWVVTRLDTLDPFVERIRMPHVGRLQVQFSEAIVLPGRDPDQWILVDSASGARISVLDVFLRENDPRSVFLRTDALMDHVLALAPDSTIADSSGNRVAVKPAYFQTRAAADTARPQFQRFLPRESEQDVVLSPFTGPGLLFNEPPPASALSDMVTAEDSAGVVRAVTASTRDGTSYALQLDPSLAPGELVLIRVQTADSLRQQRFRRLATRDLGSISGMVRSMAGDSLIIVEAFDDSGTGQPLATTSVDSTGAFIIDNLPESNYHLRLFADRNRNGLWDGGQWLPYQRAEPVTWNKEPATVRARWDSALTDTLVFRYP